MTTNTAMPVRFPVGVSDFKKLASGNYRFTDKTEFIRDVVSDGADVILINRPRRFGKTLNMSMLSYFLSIGSEEDRKIFDGLNISKHQEFCKQHQQKHPVIFISFKDVKEATYEDGYEKLVEMVRLLYAEHRYLMADGVLEPDENREFQEILDRKANRVQIQGAIKQLSCYLKRKFGKPSIILIDEYDTPIQESYLKKYYTEMVSFMRGLLGNALKDNQFLHKAVLTGITRVSQESLFSGLNNVEVYSLLRDEYSQYFGFTEAEVVELRQGLELKSTLEEIKAWYNGYRIGKHMIYNPWSIISCLKSKGELKPYWLNTSRNDPIQELLDKADSVAIRGHFYELLQGKAIEKTLIENLTFTDLDKHEGAIWSLLLYAGYLNVLSTEQRGARLVAQIAAPNREVLCAYELIVDNWFTLNTQLDTYDLFVRSLAIGDMEKFKRCLSDYILSTISYFDFRKHAPEQVFHVFMLGLVAGLKNNYVIESNVESGFGRLDVIFKPKDKSLKGIVLEFKTCKKPELMQAKAAEALQQIKDKQYVHSFKQEGVKTALIVGMAFCGKQVELAHEEVLIN